jgi:putative membrane-bound dehydrogenase-like protein
MMNPPTFIVSITIDNVHSIGNIMRLLLLLTILAIPVATAAEPVFPTRQAFAEHDRKHEMVPPDAFALSGVDDLKIEVWATSPLLFTPVSMDTDAQGRMWITEGIDYNQRSRIAAGQSIVVVSDSDNDGKADKSHIFVTEKDLRHAPMGIAVFDNKIVLSSTPDIIVYTDVDRNAVFDPKVDKREVLLTGFANKRHDHTLHAVVGSPSGQWYFSFGNCGADIKTKDNRNYLAGCYYGSAELIGKTSWDGHVYVGGVAMRINPDGTGLAAVGHNLRNTHDMAVNSFGDVFHSDNDDPAHCRSTWLMEHGNMGYADLRDGSRSWEEVAKSWEEPRDFGKGRRYSISHWRQQYPGALPPGTVYGAGSPIGNTFMESDGLGEKYRGMFLSCDMVRKELMGYQPTLNGPHVAMGEPTAFVGLKKDQKSQHFLPSDIVVGTDGALYLSDFYNDTSRRTNQLSGTIYRISRKDGKHVRPTIDFESVAGLVAALRSPANNVRTAAVNKLKAHGDAAVAPVKALLDAPNPYVRARAIWMLSQLGKPGQQIVRDLLKADGEQDRLVAFRALRLATPENLMQLVKQKADDSSPAVRREVAIALRDVAFDDCRTELAKLIAGYDGKDRWYLEAIGIAATNKEAAIYDNIVRNMFPGKLYGNWEDRAVNLAWRLHTPASIDDLHEVLKAQRPELDRFRRLVMGYASYSNDEERKYYRGKLETLAQAPGFEDPYYQLTIQEVLARDLNDLKGEGVTASHEVPKTFGVKTEVSDAKTIAALTGDAAAGKLKVGACLTCHKVDGGGVSFGPNLTYWGQNRTIEQIAHEIVDPSAHLAHGFDKPVRLSKGEHVMEGMLSNYSWHAGSLKIKLFGGETKKILFRKMGVKVQELKGHSWMPPASEMGLNDQDVRNVAEYLHTLKPSATAAAKIAVAPRRLPPPKKEEPKEKPVTGPITLPEKLLGTWTYTHQGGKYTRELTKDGYCVLRLGAKTMWRRKVEAAGENSFTLEGGLRHVIGDDGVLTVEGRYKAKK